MTEKNLSLIVAVSEDNAIGNNGGLLCRLSADLKHFKALTTGHTVIMGRKTFESLPKGALPNRRNIVVTRNAAFEAPGAEVANSIEAALKMSAGDDERFIIGGAQLYDATVDIAEKIHLTRIHAEFPDADTHFPNVDWSAWQKVEKQDFPADEKNPFAYSFETYIRK